MYFPSRLCILYTIVDILTWQTLGDPGRMRVEVLILMLLLLSLDIMGFFAGFYKSRRHTEHPANPLVSYSHVINPSVAFQ